MAVKSSSGAEAESQNTAVDGTFSRVFYIISLSRLGYRAQLYKLPKP